MKQFNVEMAQRRAQMMASVRSFFAERDVLEVETPSLCSGIAPDCHIDPFETDFRAIPGKNSGNRYFLSSPELPMKRLLSDGFPDIFQLCKVYRNGEVGRHHNPEFTMLEWYRRGYTMKQLMEETITLLQFFLKPSKVVEVTYQHVFKMSTGIDPLSTTSDTVAAMLARDKKTVQKFSSLSDALTYAMAIKVEPDFDHEALTVVYNYPREQAVLSVVDPDDSRVARRFEVYYKGMELANGFEELTDAFEYERRFHAENKRRITEGKSKLEMDEHFLAELRNGMPQCSGVAVGMDRVLMAMVNASTIDDVISFGWNRS